MATLLSEAREAGAKVPKEKS
ncbi:hypothetical protein [Flavipsychrobacter stenotrophus]